MDLTKQSITDFIRTTEKSPTLSANEIAKRLEAEGKTVYKFGFGESPFPPPGFVIEALEKNSHRKEYLSVQGHPELLKNIAKFHGEVDLINIDPKNILVGPGSKILIYNIFKAFKKANVLIPVPAWVSYEPQARLCEHKVTRLYTTYENRWRVTPELLEENCKSNIDAPIILILNYPGNPDGLGYTKEELKNLAKVCQKYNVLVVSDEIYGLLHHKGEHISIARFYPEGTIIMTGLSKWGGVGGWRLGVCILPEKIDKKFKKSLIGICSETFSCAATPVQLAAIEAYSSFQKINEHLKDQRKILSLLGLQCQKVLSSSGVKVHSPEGGFYLYLDFSNFKEKFLSKGIDNSVKMCERLLQETGVSVLTGQAFGANPDDFTARLAYVDFDGEKTLKAAKELNIDDQSEEFIQTYLKKTIEGVEKISNWLNIN